MKQLVSPMRAQWYVSSVCFSASYSAGSHTRRRRSVTTDAAAVSVTSLTSRVGAASTSPWPAAATADGRCVSSDDGETTTSFELMTSALLSSCCTSTSCWSSSSYSNGSSTSSTPSEVHKNKQLFNPRCFRRRWLCCKYARILIQIAYCWHRHLFRR